MKDACRIISVYSNVPVSGRAEYSVNLAAAIAKVTGKKTAFIDSTGQMIGISMEAGIDVLTPIEINPDMLQVHKRDYNYVVINAHDNEAGLLYDILACSDSVHFFTDSTTDKLKDARLFLKELVSRDRKDIIGRLKIVVCRLDIFDKLSEEDMSWILKRDIWAIVPEAGTLDPLIDSGGIPVVLKPGLTPYSIEVSRIAKKETGKLLGLALGSGAAFGLAHVGVIKVLEENRIPVDIISGSSMGAIIASMWGLGLSAREIEKITMTLKKKLNIMRLLDFTIPVSGVLSGARLKRFLRSILGEKTFEDLKIPVKIMIYDLANRETVTVDKGPLFDAVFMSIAVPGIFEPTVKKDKVYIDGGVSDPVPVDALVNEGVSKIIAVNVLPGPQDIYIRNMAVRGRLQREEFQMLNSPFYVKWGLMIKARLRKAFTPNIFDVIMTSMQAMEYMLAESSCKKASITIHPVVADATSIDFHLVRAFIQKGEKETISCIEEIKSLAFR